jgi:hypothetical protein
MQLKPKNYGSSIFSFPVGKKEIMPQNFLIFLHEHGVLHAHGPPNLSFFLLKLELSPSW